MNLTTIRETYYTLSSKASDIVRQLGFAGIAVIWVFKVETGTAIPSVFFMPATLLVASLTLDLLHYIVGSAVWGIYGRIKEKQGISLDTEFEAPDRINWPALVFFWLKIVTTVAAYVLLLRALYRITFP